MTSLLKSDTESVTYTYDYAEPAALTLNQMGMIEDCNDAGEELVGFDRGDLLQRHISKLLPQLADEDLICDGHLNSKLVHLARCGKRFRLQSGKNVDLFLGLIFVQLKNGLKSKIRIMFNQQIRQSDSKF